MSKYSDFDHLKRRGSRLVELLSKTSNYNLHRFNTVSDAVKAFEALHAEEHELPVERRTYKAGLFSLIHWAFLDCIERRLLNPNAKPHALLAAEASKSAVGYRGCAAKLAPDSLAAHRYEQTVTLALENLETMPPDTETTITAIKRLLHDYAMEVDAARFMGARLFQLEKVSKANRQAATCILLEVLSFAIIHANNPEGPGQWRSKKIDLPVPWWKRWFCEDEKFVEAMDWFLRHSIIRDNVLCSLIPSQTPYNAL